jgi:hypothetical protein
MNPMNVCGIGRLDLDRMGTVWFYGCAHPGFDEWLIGLMVVIVSGGLSYRIQNFRSCTFSWPDNLFFQPAAAVLPLDVDH